MRCRSSSRCLLLAPAYACVRQGLRTRDVIESWTPGQLEELRDFSSGSVLALSNPANASVAGSDAKAKANGKLLELRKDARSLDVLGHGHRNVMNFHSALPRTGWKFLSTTRRPVGRTAARRVVDWGHLSAEGDRLAKVHADSQVLDVERGPQGAQ